MKFQPIDCPCCKRPVTAPNVEIIVDRYNLTGMEERILRAVWKGKGYPVPTERIFDSMYSDDPDGGPGPGAMYRAFKVALCHMRAKLAAAGAGVGIENAGYRGGYRLILPKNTTEIATSSSGSRTGAGIK